MKGRAQKDRKSSQTFNHIGHWPVAYRFITRLWWPVNRTELPNFIVVADAKKTFIPMLKEENIAAWVLDGYRFLVSNQGKLRTITIERGKKILPLTHLVLQVLTFNTNHGVVTDNVIASYECITRKLITNNRTTGWQKFKTHSKDQSIF